VNVDTPLLAKDPNTGLFKLTIGVEKTTQLTNFFPFPMTAPQTTINAEGKLEKTELGSDIVEKHACKKSKLT